MPGKGLESLRLQRRHLILRSLGLQTGRAPARLSPAKRRKLAFSTTDKVRSISVVLVAPRGPDDPARTECSISWSILQQESLESGNSLSVRRLAGTPAPHPFWMIAWD